MSSFKIGKKNEKQSRNPYPDQQKNGFLEINSAAYRGNGFRQYSYGILSSLSAHHRIFIFCFLCVVVSRQKMNNEIEGGEGTEMRNTYGHAIKMGSHTEYTRRYSEYSEKRKTRRIHMGLLGQQISILR